MPFIFRIIHNFLIDKEANPIIFDFGIHKIFLEPEEYSSYFLPNTSEMNNEIQNKIKTNVMNYGITLLKILSGKNLDIKDKRIELPEDISLSEEFNIFLSKCLTRNYIKRATWNELGNYKFVMVNSVETKDIMDDKALIDDEKLNKIFDYLNNKFETIINYYNKINLENNPNISQIEVFISATLFEMKIVNLFFNRNIEIKPFSNQQEISFISIDINGETSKCDLNFVNPVLKDVLIINMNNNKLIKDFLINLQKNIKKLQKLLITVQSYVKFLHVLEIITILFIIY